MLRRILQVFIIISIVFSSAVVSFAQNESAPEQEEWESGFSRPNHNLDIASLWKG